MDAAAEIGAKGLIVHGGHVNKRRRPGEGLRQLAQGHRGHRPQDPAADREHRRRRQRDGPPRSSGSPGSGTRSPPAEGVDDVGFCLDTCHAHAGGIELATAVEQVRAITGRIDLVHANDSRDAFDSGADRHANFGDGQLDHDDFVERRPRRRRAGRSARPRAAPSEHQADFAWLRSAALTERVGFPWDARRMSVLPTTYSPWEGPVVSGERRRPTGRTCSGGPPHQRAHGRRRTSRVVEIRPGEAAPSTIP